MDADAEKFRAGGALARPARTDGRSVAGMEPDSPPRWTGISKTSGCHLTGQPPFAVIQFSSSP